MADNSTLPATADIVRDVQKGGASGPKSQVVIIDRGGSGAEDLSPLDGVDITTPTAMPAGGVGIRGWLSAIWTKLNGTLAVTGTFFQATQPVSIAATVAVSGTVTANAGTGTLATKETRSSTGTSTQPSIATTAGGTTVLASNANRLGASVRNDGANDVFMLLGTGTVTSSVYTTKMSPGAYFEVPYGYTGVITGIAVTAAVTLRVTEYT